MMFVDDLNIIGGCAQRISVKNGITFDEAMQLLKDSGFYDLVVECYNVIEESEEEIDEKAQYFIDRYLSQKATGSVA